MGQCDFEVETTGPIAAGRQVTIRLKPPLAHPCKVEVIVNGKPVSLDDFGGFRVHGIGASGSVTITPQGPLPWGTIRFNVTCPECSRSFSYVLPGGTTAPAPVPYQPPPYQPPRHRHHGFHDEDEEGDVIRIFGIPVYRRRRRHHRRGQW